MLSPATHLARPARLLAAVSAVAMLSGCAAFSDEGSATEGREVVASFYPLAWVTEQVAGDDWTVTNLTSPGGEPHDLELTIDATADLTDAAMVVYLSGFQPAVDDGISTNAQGDTVDVADLVDLVPMEEHGTDEHADEEEHTADDGHDHGELDPHFWLDPLLMADVADGVADQLAELDPDGASTYRDNAAELRTRLEDLDQQYEQGLASCERDTIVVTHDAFGYLDRYGIHVASIVGLTPEAEPTPATLARLSEVIEDEGVTTVFSERIASPAMAESLASDAGVETAVLDPIEGLTDQTADDDYLSLMQQNLTALEEANGC